MAHEITIASCIFCRDHREPIRQNRQGKSLLKIHDSLLGEALDGLLLFQLLDSQRVLGIHIIHYQREAVQLAVIHLHFHKHSHTLGQRRTCDRFEIWSYESVFGRPDDGRGFRHQAFGITLRKFQIAMTAASRLYCTDLGLQPKTVRKKQFYPLFKPFLKLI